MLLSRRALLTAPAVLPAFAAGPVTVPLRLAVDGNASWRAGSLERFHKLIWPEAVRDFERCGVRFDIRREAAAVSRSSLLRTPVITGLDPASLNLLVTRSIPEQWAGGRAINGVTLLYRGHHLCIVSASEAHPHRFPLLAVNTCVHELLHALLLDIFEKRPSGAAGNAREFRIDWWATRMWLFRDGAAVQSSARIYVNRLRGAVEQQG